MLPNGCRSVFEACYLDPNQSSAVHGRDTSPSTALIGTDSRPLVPQAHQASAQVWMVAGHLPKASCGAFPPSRWPSPKDPTVVVRVASLTCITTQIVVGLSSPQCLGQRIAVSLVPFRARVESTDLYLRADRDLGGAALAAIREARSTLEAHIAATTLTVTPAAGAGTVQATTTGAAHILLDAVVYSW